MRLATVTLLLFASPALAASLAVIDRLLGEFPALDPQRLYITGLSMGGFGVWDAIVRQPRRFRAAVPICGGYDEDALGPVVDLPLWTFHAADDPVVTVE